MDLDLLSKAVSSFQNELFSSITTASYAGNIYDNGQKAKEALIRSQTLIMNIHECVKLSLMNTLSLNSNFNWDVYPPIGSNSPELKIYGLLKGKDQDLVFLPVKQQPSTIATGPNSGEIDNVGEIATSKSLIVGVRSQMSSVNKNFDTLMERAFAETLNLRLRTPNITMGEVYLLPLKELDQKAMLTNRVRFNERMVDIPKFVKIFDAFSNRTELGIDHQYKYDASALVLIDLEKKPALVVTCGEELKDYGYDQETCDLFDKVSPFNFDNRLIYNYKKFNS